MSEREIQIDYDVRMTILVRWCGGWVQTSQQLDAWLRSRESISKDFAERIHSEVCEKWRKRELDRAINKVWIDSIRDRNKHYTVMVVDPRSDS